MPITVVMCIPVVTMAHHLNVVRLDKRVNHEMYGSVAYVSSI